MDSRNKLWTIRLNRIIPVLFIVAAFLTGAADVRADHSNGGQWPGDHRYVVAFAQDTTRNDWRTAQVRELKEALAPYPFIEFKYSDAEGKTANQILDIENFVAEGVDILVTSPVDQNAMVPVISQAFKKGIPVFLLSRSVNSDDYTAFITGDNFEIGRQAASYIADRLHGNGKILMLEGVSTSSTAQARTNGFLAELSKFKGLSISFRKHADYLRGKSILAIQEALDKGIKFDAIYAHSDSMATGARVGLLKAGIDPSSLVIVGIDYISEARKAILAGEQSASFTYPTYGKEGGDLIIKLLKGEEVPKKNVVYSTRITKENAASVEPIF